MFLSFRVIARILFCLALGLLCAAFLPPLSPCILGVCIGKFNIYLKPLFVDVRGPKRAVWSLESPREESLGSRAVSLVDQLGRLNPSRGPIRTNLKAPRTNLGPTLGSTTYPRERRGTRLGMSTYAPRHSPSVFSTPASTTLFRRLTWEGTVPLEVRVDPKELPANSDRGLECYYIQAPRVSYLPLLVPEIKRFLMDVVFDETAARVVKEEDWWFESEEGSLLKWCVPDPSSDFGCPLQPRCSCSHHLENVGIGPSASYMTTTPSLCPLVPTSLRRSSCPSA